MKRYYLQGQDVTYSQFKLNEISYPSNWCQIIDDIEVVKLGIIIIDDEPAIVNENNISDEPPIVNENNISDEPPIV